MWRKITRWLLPVSLAVNLFFAIVAIRHQPFLHPHPPGPRDVVGFLKANLSPADAAIMQQSFASHAAALAEVERGNQQFQDKVRSALTATPFDPEQLRGALADGRALHKAMEDSMAGAFVDAASKISPEGRAKLAASQAPGGFRRHGPPPDGFRGPPPPDGEPPPGPPPPR
jgi:uncharacterized membrane protein